MTLPAGTRLGPYEVLALLGAGGMGEVYRARDTRLGREAAVKILPRALSADHERLARFESEARAASALNHPNIATIYDVGESDGVAWIGMELIEGATLREMLTDGPIPPRRAAALAAQLAEGLAAAHEAGIVHRDFKPENVLVTREGRAKIVDFGLARSQPEPAVVSSAPTAAQRTAPGTVLGTVGYMSPEQVRGLPADHRTDIFALGAVLYEMVAGRRAFAAASPADVLSSILREDPPDLSSNAAPALDRIVKRCLEKNAEARFQSARDLAFALESLSGASGAAPSAGEQRRPRRPLSPGWAAAALALSAFGLGWLLRPALGPAQGPVFSRAVRFTSGPGRQFAPAIAPDGKWIAYLSDAGGRMDAWVKFLAGGEAANLTAQGGLPVLSRADLGGLEISPDGSFLLVTSSASGNSVTLETWAVPAPLGGPPRPFLGAGSGSVRFSPDGRRIVFARAGGSRGDALFVADADGGNPREILKQTGGLHTHWPAWSPDGAFIYFIYGITSTNGEPSEIFRVSSSGGTPEPVVATSRRAVYPAPLPDGRGLIYAANVDAADTALWWRPLKSGAPRRLTTGVGSYIEPRISADGSLLVATLVEERQSLFSVPVQPDTSGSIRTVTDGYGGDLDPSVSPAGELLVFSSRRSGTRNLWLAHADATAVRPLTTGNAIDERPAFSPDGRQVAFVSDRGGQRGIWLIGVDRGASRRLAAAQVLDTLSWSPNGKEILFTAPAGDLPGIFRVTVEDGRVTRLPTPGPAHSPAWSPREDLVAYLEPTAGGPTILKFVDTTGRPVERELPERMPPLQNGILAWSRDGRRLATMAAPGTYASSVWLLEPGSAVPAQRLAVLPAQGRGRGLAWAADGLAVLLGSTEASSNIVLFTRDR